MPMMSMAAPVNTVKYPSNHFPDEQQTSDVLIVIIPVNNTAVPTMDVIPPTFDMVIDFFHRQSNSSAVVLLISDTPHDLLYH